MLIDDLNTLVGPNTIHAIPHVTASTISGFISPSNLAVQMDGDIGLYHYTGSWNKVNTTLNTLFISLSIGFEMPAGYNGISYGGTIHMEWPASRTGSHAYVCATNSDLLLLDQGLQGDLAVVADKTYLLNLRPSYISINWLLLISTIISASTIVGLDKNSVGLSNVDNTSDTNKPISAAEALALATKQALIEKNASNGYAGLDANAKLLVNLLPDLVLGGVVYKGVWDMTIPLPTPTIDIKGHYYIASVSGNGYSTADWAVCDGTTWDKVDNNNFIQTVQGRKGDVVISATDIGLENVDNTSDLDKVISTATQLALDLKADKRALTSFSDSITGIVNGMLSSKANQTDVTTLNTQVTDILTDLGLKANLTDLDPLITQITGILTDLGTKATQTDVTTLNTQITGILTDLGTKATQTDVTTLNTQITGILTDLGTKATQTDVTTLSTQVTNILTDLGLKANSSDLTPIVTQISDIIIDLGLKANAIDVTTLTTTVNGIITTLGTKADQFDFDALVKHVYDIQTGLDAKVDQPDFDALLVQSFVQSIAIANKVDKTVYEQYVFDTQTTLTNMQTQITTLQNPI